jgi:hypothetical protein
MELMINTLTQSWRKEASCKGSTLNFYSKRVNKSIMSICATCPSKEPCYDYALRNEEYGYWGGSTERQRNKERMRLGIKLPELERADSRKVYIRKIKPIVHDTENGYRSHSRNKIPFITENGIMCDCKGAHTRYLREYRSNQSKSKEVQ